MAHRIGPFLRGCKRQETARSQNQTPRGGTRPTGTGRTRLRGAQAISRMRANSRKSSMM
jgi:hypothetical protein